MSAPGRYYSRYAAFCVLLLAAARAAAGQEARPARITPDSARAWLDELAEELGPQLGAVAIDLDTLRAGSRTVAAGESVAGDVVALGGSLHVYGKVSGNAVALRGDVVLHPGSQVAGNVVAFGGAVHADSGTVGGEMVGVRRTIERTPAGAVTSGGRRRSTGLVLGWFACLAAIGLVTALFARSNLEKIADAIQDNYWRSFLFGISAELALLPALILTCVVLLLTLIGILLIPFAVVAFVLATVGALALGFVAMAYANGSVLLMRRASRFTPSALLALQSVLVGVALYFLLWMSAAALHATLLGSALRLVAVAVTWVAVTVGFGATLLSRGGTRGAVGPVTGSGPPEDEDAWQTPTPVSGVAAARRPTPAPRPGAP